MYQNKPEMAKEFESKTKPKAKLPKRVKPSKPKPKSKNPLYKL
jgi:hypothetical protein